MSILVFLEGLGMDKFGVFRGHLESLLPFWYTLLPFGICVSFLVCFFPIGLLYQEKAGIPVWR
jgi:hypothetical protein